MSPAWSLNRLPQSELLEIIFNIFVDNIFYVWVVWVIVCDQNWGVNLRFCTTSNRSTCVCLTALFGGPGVGQKVKPFSNALVLVFI